MTTSVDLAPRADEFDPSVDFALRVNGRDHDVRIDPRRSLLDLLREDLALTGTKYGCNQGACGACTVLVEGRRVLSCLTLAVQTAGCEITTIEGVEHPLQAAFVEHDGMQCGYCTPGQICSGLGMAEEAERGVPSAVSADVAAETFPLDSAEIRERLSGNLCRCGAHNGIIAAMHETLA